MPVYVRCTRLNLQHLSYSYWLAFHPSLTTRILFMFYFYVKISHANYVHEISPQRSKVGHVFEFPHARGHWARVAGKICRSHLSEIKSTGLHKPRMSPINHRRTSLETNYVVCRPHFYGPARAARAEAVKRGNSMLARFRRA